MASKQQHADRFSRKSNLTLAEVALAEMVSAEYHGLVNLLQRYVEFLRHIVGNDVDTTWRSVRLPPK
jgi:hypothetical protein